MGPPLPHVPQERDQESQEGEDRSAAPRGADDPSAVSVQPAMIFATCLWLHAGSAVGVPCLWRSRHVWATSAWTQTRECDARGHKQLFSLTTGVDGHQSRYVCSLLWVLLMEPCTTK